MPQAVRGVKIPKPKGGYRQLGIPTVVDRLVQQAILQVLSPRYELIFSERSYGFRPGRSAHQTLHQAAEYVKSGKRYVVDTDLAKIFDEVNHSRLLWVLSTRIGDKRVIKLIHRFLQTGLLTGGLVNPRIKGFPTRRSFVATTVQHSLSWTFGIYATARSSVCLRYRIRCFNFPT
ncbi:MAG: hypothetical protein D6772_09315 [Bacteroidetes bacterium]|nr:MAG: hypothetical protein D6772_09315 [Bacteroidota bacterium]